MCTICSANYFCTPTSTIPCYPGTYSNAGSSRCDPCPGGYQCSWFGSYPVICTAGTYAMSGSDSCSQCDEGYSCPRDGMSQPEACEAGVILLNVCIFYLVQT